jgi:4-hydroxybenzoyl-CoA thioesterase/acyl-CoA thioester hydrolase
VEFRDTDAAGIAHFTALFAYMEEAEHAFLRHLGLSVHQRDKQGETISWPRVAAQCDFQQPVKFEDVVEIAVSIEKLGGASVVYRFELSQAGRAVAQGTMTSVCCQIRAGQPPRAIPIPEPIRQKLACHLAAREA